MAQIATPDAWRKTVCAILETEATDRSILWTDDAEQDYELDATGTKMRNGDPDLTWRL